MADEIVFQRMKQRRDYAANWAATNDVLLEGEIGIELDTGCFKIGDESTPWLDLPYAGFGFVEFDGRIEGSMPRWDDTAKTWKMLNTDLRTGVVGAVFNGGTGDIALDSECEVYVPYAFTILEWRVICDDVPAILNVDIRVCPFATYPPELADSITGGAPINVITQKASDATMTGWTKTFPAQSTVRFVVQGASHVKRATIQLVVRKD